MKIAVTYDNGEVWQHFGRTENFKFYDVEDGKVVSSEVVNTEGRGQDMGPWWISLADHGTGSPDLRRRRCPDYYAAQCAGHSGPIPVSPEMRGCRSGRPFLPERWKPMRMRFMRAATIMRREEESGGLSLLENGGRGTDSAGHNPLLTDWYETNKRPLPWRTDTNPYHIWVSEIMLQQTRVETVIPYYERFLKSLPDVQALLCGPEEELLKLWESLDATTAGSAICRRPLRQSAARSGFLGGASPSAFQDPLSCPGFGDLYGQGCGLYCFRGRRSLPWMETPFGCFPVCAPTGGRWMKTRQKKAVSAEPLAVTEAEKEPYSPENLIRHFMDLSADVIRTLPRNARNVRL